MRRVLIAIAAMLVLGAGSGIVWIWLSSPAEWEVRATGIVLTEAAATGQFSVIVMFVLVGAASSLVWSWVASWWLRDIGWLLTPLVVAATLLAALVAWRIGVTFGPPSPETVEGASVGDRLPSMLKVDGVAPFLVWPIFGLIGVLTATWLGRRQPAGTAAD